MALDDTFRMLSGLPFFKAFDRDSLRLVAFAARPKRLRAGDVLFRSGDLATGAYLIEEGSIGLWLRPKTDPDQIHSTGTLLGETSLLIDMPRPCSAIALENSKLLSIDRSTVMRILNEAPHIARALEQRMQADLAGFMGELSAVRTQLVGERPTV